MRLCPDGRLRRRELTDDPDPSWLQAAVVGAGRALLLRSGPRDRRATAWLADSGLREAVVVPLRGEAGVIGSLRVADRRPGGRSFAAADVDLLERVAEQASVSLRNGRLVSQLRHDALHDPLTGLPNRAQLQQALTAALEQVVSGRTEGATVMVLDLDGFKDVNDSLGHASGDRLLQEVARRLERAVGEDGSVARLGGDEFAVVLPGTAAQAEVLAVGGRVLHGLSVPVALDGLAVDGGRAPSASRWPRSTAPTWPGCSSGPTPRCTRRRAPAAGCASTAAGSAATTRGGSAWCRACRRPSRPGRWSCTCSRWRRSPAAGSAGWRRWCAGCTPSSARCARTRWCRSPSGPA